MTIAEKWANRLDTTKSHSRDVQRMQATAVDEIQHGSPMLNELYIFADGSGLYEKRARDWYPVAKAKTPRADA